MGRIRFTAEQIIGKLREAELLLGQGTSIGEAIRKIGVSEQTYYRWRKEYGGKGWRSLLCDKGQLQVVDKNWALA